MTAALSASLTGGTPPYTYAWNLGDGATSTQSAVNHTYTSAGNYTASLTVTDSHGVISQAGVQLTVYPALSISTTATPAAGDAPLQVGFTASASGGLAPYSYSWGFGDTATAAGSSATHSYGAGAFHPTLTVHDAAGGTWSGVVATISANAPPVAAAAPGASNPGQGAGPGGAPAGPPPAAATPTPAQPSPSAEPSPSSPASPSARAVQPAADLGGSGSNGNAALMATLLGSVVASGLGGYLFLRWRRGRLF
jgi:PKD repeat protein